ncbi:LysR family transcriptional regulator, partial [Vibrio sp. 10N.261.48.A2]
MVQEDMVAGRLIPILEQDKLANTDRERVNAVYYKSSSVSKRISAFIDFIQPRLSL